MVVVLPLALILHVVVYELTGHTARLNHGNPDTRCTTMPRDHEQRLRTANVRFSAIAAEKLSEERLIISTGHMIAPGEDGLIVSWQ